MFDFSILLCLGPALFQRLLTGIRSMDRHFSSAPLQRNLPVVMGLIRVWYCNFYGCRQFSILPTPGRLSGLPGYIGRLITMNSRTMDVGPGAEPAENDLNEQMLQQEMICQQIMVNATLHPCDFIGLCRDKAFPEQHNKLHMAKMFALTKSLAFGSHWQELRGDSYPPSMEQCLPLEGNHPSNTLLAESLTPETLGEILALYGHSIYTQQVVGQWDVAELQGLQAGKLEAGAIIKELEQDSEAAGHDSSTAGLIRHYRSISGADGKLYLS
jgi:glucose-6-phosphate isomerase